MSKIKNKSKIDIIPNSKTVILCTNNVDKLKLSDSFIDKDTDLITTCAKNITNNSTCDKLVKLLKIKDLFSFEFDTLSTGEKQMIQVCNILLTDKDTIVMVDAISNVSSLNKEKIFKFIKKLNKTIIYITNNKEDIMYFDNVILYDNEVILNEKLDKAIQMEKEFKSVGFTLPFMSELSLKLKYYNLVEKPIISMDRMVNKLWK